MRLLGTATTTLLVVAAVGLACWFAYATTTGASLITFRTGSMSPTMPQGSVAVTVPVQAADLRVGDVVTVQRANERMPVTHRVVSIVPVSPQADNAADLRAAAPGSGPPDLSSPAARELVMQGDGNQVPDTLPYVVTDARKVVFAAPHVGNALMVLQSPIGTGTLIVGVGALVTWAFWPRSKPEPEPEPELEPEPTARAASVLASAPRHAAESAS